MTGWFPRLSPDGHKLITSEGGRHGAVWIDWSTYAYYKGNGPGIYLSSGASWEDWPEPISLAGGGGIFAAEYWGRNREDYRGVRLSNTIRHDEAYHPALGPDGYLVFLRGHDSTVQELADAIGHVYDHSAPMEYPSVSLQGVAWSRYVAPLSPLKETYYAQRTGFARRVHASGIGVIEFKPIAVTTPAGDWIATYTHHDVRVYPVGSKHGYLYPSEDARNVDAQWDGNFLRVVWNSPTGEIFDRRQDLAEPRVSLEVVQPPPVDPPEEPPVSLPDHRFIVEGVDRAHPQLLEQNTRETVKEFYWIATNALHAHDPKWGMLTKTAGENHQIIEGQRVSMDAAAYQGSEEVADFLTAAGDGPGTGGVTWGVAPRRPSNLWLKPIPLPGDGPPPPPLEKHVYDGGENDTGICDVCGNTRGHPIHISADEANPAIVQLQKDVLALQGRLDTVADRVLQLEVKPPVHQDVIRQMVREVLNTASVEVRVGRSFGHSHGASAEVKLP